VRDRAASAWVVVKFGGTSVSTRANWQNIASVVSERLATGARVLVVHSAVSGITDQLEKLLTSAVHGSPAAALETIERRHRQLAADLEVPVSPALEQQLTELKQLAAGVGLIGEVSDRTRARVLAAGELLATEIGARFLAAQGLPITWADARTLLQAEDRGASAKASVLSATCDFSPDAALADKLSAMTPVVLTQGFVASDDAGNTVLLGRGGSDTSAAYLAAKLQAKQLEIWTDVPGMFSANPKSTPSARLLHVLHYDEAQEIASSGAKVLHPRCILPARQYQIPLYVYATQMPHMRGTLLTNASGDGAGQVKAVCTKKGITLVSMESPGMWHEVGFLANAFAIFKDHGMSVDLVSTSETNVTVSLDAAANTLDGDLLADLLRDLSKLCRAEVIGPCASVSLVGRNIRGILHRLGPAFELFAEQKVYLVSQSANDLNFTFVVDESQSDRLVNQLHDLLIQAAPNDPVLGPTWEQLFAPSLPAAAPAKTVEPWWRTQRAQLLELMRDRANAYVYDLATVKAQAESLRALKAVDRALYALKANPHPRILETLNKAGLAFECVSIGEVEHVLRCVPGIDPKRILFTPNFAPREEYERGLQLGVHVTIDNRYALEAWPEMFRGRDVLLRIDTGVGRGHHHHVKTAGTRAKFGIAVDETAAVAALVRAAGARVVGLHSHAGSGVFDTNNWSQVGRVLAALLTTFPDVRVVDVGGGLGVPDRFDAAPLDLSQLATALAGVKAALGGRELWLEPGRYLVAQSGVLLAKVTQVKHKGSERFVGLTTGMNSLLRPALYGAHHDIINLTRIDAESDEPAHVVGPICESADFLGHDRLLPDTREGDVMLIATAGAYGHVMGSNYNHRAPAEELIL
jgi:bifunctional diaminopimelate decarboxylase / aspartate kinase